MVYYYYYYYYNKPNPTPVIHALLKGQVCFQKYCCISIINEEVHRRVGMVGKWLGPESLMIV